MKMNCPNCDQHLDIPDDLAGQTIDCPACGENFAVENATSEAPESGQSKLKFAQSPKNPGLSKKQISQQQSRQAGPSEDVLRGLSEDISKGSPTAMHLASQLGGTSTPLRETAASSFLGPVTKVLIGVGIALFILFRMGGGAGGCMMGSTAKMQNELASIESDMVDGIQDSETPEEAGEVVAKAVTKLKKLNITKLDDEYQAAIKDYTSALQKWSVALKRGDFVKADQYDDERLDATFRLNEIMKRKGRYN